VAAHPYRPASGLGERNVIGFDFDAIEASNGRSSRKGNAKAVRLARSESKPMTGGSDAHWPEAVGRAWTEVPDDCRTADDVVRAIRDGHVSSAGKGKSALGSIRYLTVATVRWAGRGFKRI